MQNICDCLCFHYIYDLLYGKKENNDSYIQMKAIESIDELIIDKTINLTATNLTLNDLSNNQQTTTHLQYWFGEKRSDSQFDLCNRSNSIDNI